jgi:Cell wall-active antibiotics response 4TMS YvqF
LRPIYSVQGETGRLEYRLDGWRGNQSWLPFDPGFDNASMQVSLNPSVPITSLTVQGGAAEADIDVRELRVNNLDVQIGAATTDIRVPRTGMTNVHVSGGAATINIDVPDGVAARITHRGGLSTLEVNENRFPSIGNNRYQSPDYDQAANRVDISLETGVTTIEIN